MEVPIVAFLRESDFRGAYAQRKKPSLGSAPVGEEGRPVSALTCESSSQRIGLRCAWVSDSSRQEADFSGAGARNPQSGVSFCFPEMGTHPSQ